jgi:hypothetical protein
VQDAHDSARAVGHRTELRRFRDAVPIPSAFADIRVGATSVPRHRCRGRAHVHARVDARSSMRCLQASACGPEALTPICLRARHILRQPNLEWRHAGFCRYTAACLAGRTRTTRHMQHATCNMQHAACNTPHAARNMQCATCHTQHALCNMQHTQPNLEGRRRSLPRRSCKSACRRVGCRCMCVVGNGRRVTNRSSRLIIVVYSPSAAPARSCSSGTQRSFWALILRCVCLGERSQWRIHRDRPIAAARPTFAPI